MSTATSTRVDLTLSPVGPDAEEAKRLADVGNYLRVYASSYPGFLSVILRHPARGYVGGMRLTTEQAVELRDALDQHIENEGGRL